MKTRIINALLVACAVGVTGPVQALDDGDGTANNCNEFNVLRNPYFGDLHVHTTLSLDASGFGTTTTPAQAYEFAKGQLIGLHPFDQMGDPLRSAQIDRPLDFAMVSDHAEDIDAAGWQAVQAAAALHYDRSTDCEFTTFVGYEWTRSPILLNEFGQIEGLNLHRNVLFRNSVVPASAVSAQVVKFPEILWDSLQGECIDLVDGNNYCDVLTIPHNSNFSQGLMFEAFRPGGAPYDQNYAQRRARFEPLIEVIQHKGQSECLFSANDELCTMELVPFGHLLAPWTGATQPKEESTIRWALTEGLSLKEQVNANPLRLGMVGGTDTHLGTPGLVEESAAYPGLFVDPPPPEGEGVTDWIEMNPGGLAVIWAEQNSRAALFDAMQRRETYATSGPRHVVRFFAGWDLPSDMCALPNAVDIGYANGVPMGSILPFALQGETTPQFFVSAMKDAGTLAHPGNDLQRIQIIKGWIDTNGDKHEQVFDVAGDPFNGAGVDLNTCATTGTGFSSLCQVWQDPNFELDENAYYYARVVENPSCRWQQRQCVEATVPINCADPGSVPPEYAACCDEDFPKTVQERSWTSPIWYDKPPPGC
ncbi:MAG: DUF3604 domain-containing protein [Gammaproteobacteria bacterium]|nr:DUF3604 domain-containing protein [Gammaproteobacteria bacterium]